MQGIRTMYASICFPISRGRHWQCWARKALHASVRLVTDGLASFAAAGAEVAAHGAIIVSPGRLGELAVFEWVNIFIAK
jgi:hypothetical protein